MYISYLPELKKSCEKKWIKCCRNLENGRAAYQKTIFLATCG